MYNLSFILHATQMTTNYPKWAQINTCIVHTLTYCNSSHGCHRVHFSVTKRNQIWGTNFSSISLFIMCARDEWHECLDFFPSQQTWSITKWILWQPCLNAGPPPTEVKPAFETATHRLPHSHWLTMHSVVGPGNEICYFLFFLAPSGALLLGAIVLIGMKYEL